MSDESEVPTIGEYQGKPMIVLNPDSQYKFQFGVKKAQLILQNIEYIRRFAESNGTSLDE